MEEISLRDFRCFRGEQTARLAPLTLVVGENSTGKTSLIALIRALWDIAYNDAVPDFKEDPYDLGSFSEIVHHTGGRGGRADSFQAGFRVGASEGPGVTPLSFQVTFRQKATAPVPAVRRIANGTVAVTVEQSDDTTRFHARASNGSWEGDAKARRGALDESSLFPLSLVALRLLGDHPASTLSEEDMDSAMRLLHLDGKTQCFASAPVRSKPRRTYDPARPSRDPEGDYVPMYLAHLVRQQNKEEWNVLRSRIETFGREAGLFDELAIKSLGGGGGEPFQVQVRKLGRRTKGPWRNLIDVGYGVSQVLPLITELSRVDAPAVFLLQQPEVHLHPSAQAALGTLFCDAARSRQLIVETHSDHLINRVRLDVRDGKGALSPEDVSILYFERNEHDVRIHSLRIDEAGNVLDAPAGYGRFFMDETARSLRY